MKVESEKFQKDLDTLDFLERHYNSYQAYKIRKPIFDRVGVDVPFLHSEFVEKVYKTVISDAKKFPGHQEILRKTRERPHTTLDRIGIDFPLRHKFVEQVYKAAMENPSAFPNDQVVLGTLGKPRPTYASAARLREIVEWTTTDKEKSRTPELIRPLQPAGLNLRNNQLIQLPAEFRMHVIRVLLPLFFVNLSNPDSQEESSDSDSEV